MSVPTLQEQIAAVAKAEAGILPPASAGQIVQDDGQNTSDAPPSTVVATEGRITPASVDVGTNAPTVALQQSQSTPQSPPDSETPAAPQTAGAGAGNDDSVSPNKNATQSAVDNIFNQPDIVPQPNVLDQYASYTYQASVYLMKPEALQQMVNSGRKTIAGCQLLFQSGGAPVSGRNPYFSNDYYIDKISMTSTIVGKGSNAAHNVNQFKMTVVEPAGITLIENLDKAVENYLGTAGNKKQNFNAQLYLLVIRFFGYDDKGNLVQAGNTASGATSTAPGSPFVEKYYPFSLSKLTFKVGNKLVEYELECTANQYQINVGQSRGTIPYNVELSGLTVKDALTGTAVVNTAASDTTTQNTTTTAPQAPPNASTAPSAKATVRQGLLTALNEYQQDLVKQGIYTYPDVYSIEFVSTAIEQATIKKPGGDKSNDAPAQPTTAAGQVSPATQSVDPNSRLLTATAGKSLVQFIEEVVRNSSYVEDQQLITILEKDGTKVPNGTTAQNLAWYKISLQSTPIKYDPKRNDYAFNIKYIVHPYKVTEIVSNYFAQPKFSGVHKQYYYWFTGQNTQILSYEQTYNNLYNMVMSGASQPNSSTKTNDNVKMYYAPQSGATTQGALNNVNEPAANAADYFYSPSDNAKCEMSIIGDPAWLQQGEAFGINSKNMNFGPFLADGTINMDSQQILFQVLFNYPGDYNLNTGLMDPSQQTQNTTGNAGKPGQQAGGGTSGRSFTYIANKVVSEFNKGKFTQTLTGTRTNYDKPTTKTADTGRVPAAGAATTSRVPSVDAQRDSLGLSPGESVVSDPATTASPSTETSRPSNTIVPTESLTQSVAPPPQPLPSTVPTPPPTSDGVPVGLDNTNSVPVFRADQVNQLQPVSVATAATGQNILPAPQRLPADPTLVIFGGAGTDPSVNTTPPQDIVKEA